MSTFTTESARWQRIQELFLDALERPAAERTALLDTTCGSDADLRNEVLSLLAAHERTDGIATLEDPRTFDEELPTEGIGPYRLLRSLGAGGMGTVYLAEREGSDYRQTVALKVIRGGRADAALNMRLRGERRILARLEHPGIARLIDGGVTPWGQPFYAMEYVSGTSVLEYCDAHHLTVRERLRLFLRICDAVQHAHQQLVVHRDLKPGNILVTEDGQPKLLDFGIAKLLATSEEELTTTRTAPWITPAYASPEQVRGAQVSTLSDVYSLGVLLYEMLSGVRPYRLDGRSPADVERIVCEEIPAKPSTAPAGEDAAATERILSARRTTADRLRRELAGDLDTIVLQAQAKEPAHRYASVTQLAEDVRRHLDGRPVMARPATLRYRARKFVQRHRGAAGAAALALCALLIGTGLALWQARRATEQARIAAAERDRAAGEAAKAQRVAGLMVDLFRLNDPNEALGDTITARQMLDRGTERIEREFGDQPDIQAAMLLDVARVYRNLGLLPRAESLVRRSIELRESRFGQLSLEAADAHAQLGQVLAERGQRDEAIEELRRALRIREPRAGVAPDSIIAQMQTSLAWELRARGDYDEAARLFESAATKQRALFGETAPQVASAILGLAAAHHDRGHFAQAESLFQRALTRADTARPDPVAADALLNIGVLRRLREEYRSAEPLLRSAFQMHGALYEPGHPAALEAATEWGRELADLGRWAEAQRVLADGLAHALQSLGPSHPRVSSLRQSLGYVLSLQGDFPHGLAHLDTVLSEKRARYAGDHADLAFALLYAADARLDYGRLRDAETMFNEALAMGQRLGDTQNGVHRILAQRGLATIARQRGQLADAKRRIDESLNIAAKRLRPNHRYTREVLRTKAELLIDQGHADEALSILEVGLTAERTSLPSRHPNIGITLQEIANAQLAMGDAAAAEHSLTEALSHFQELPRTHWRIGVLRSQLGSALRAQGREEDALQLLSEGARILRNHLGPQAYETKRAEERANDPR